MYIFKYILKWCYFWVLKTIIIHSFLNIVVHECFYYDGLGESTESGKENYTVFFLQKE